MDFHFVEYNDEQRKQYINASLSYQSYLEYHTQFFKSYRYRMGWNKANGKEYLFKECLDTKHRESLGPRNSDTETIFAKFNKQKSELKEKLANAKDKLKTESKLNKFYRVGRAPNMLVDFFRKVNEYGLDEKLLVVGTNALYAYEAYASVYIGDEHLSTYDIDIFNKREKKLSVTMKTKLPQKTIKGILLDVDKSFRKMDGIPYRFSNDKGDIVEIITPISDKEMQNDEFSGVLNLEMPGIKWLRSSKILQQMIVGLNGNVAYINTIAPLEYAVYKYWLGMHERKDRMKKQRDIKQSFLVTDLIINHFPVINIKEDILSIQNMSQSARAEYMHDVYETVIED